MPFDIWSELVVTAVCGASLVDRSRYFARVYPLSPRSGDARHPRATERINGAKSFRMLRRVLETDYVAP